MPLGPFIRAVAPDWGPVRAVLYNAPELRPSMPRNRFDGFTSSLFISPYQNHELLKQVAQQAAQATGVAFVYQDFRPLFPGRAERQGAWLLYAEVLRSHLLRGGALPQGVETHCLTELAVIGPSGRPRFQRLI